jgi:hypothetical protein
MTVPKLSQQSEDALGAALTDVSTHVNAGMSPNDAIVKAAQVHSIPAQHVRIMTRAYNNGRTVQQVKTSGEPGEKAASFPLADSAEILERLFPSEFKTAAAEMLESVISPDYSMSPEWWLRRREKAARVQGVYSNAPLLTEKQAAAAEQDDTPYHPAPHGAASDHAAIVAHSNNQRITRELELQKHARVKTAYEVAAVLDNIRTYFRTPGAASFPTVEKNAQVMFGDRAVRLLGIFSREIPALTKQAHVEHPVDWAAAPYSLIKVALDTMQRYHDIVEQLEPQIKVATEKAQENLRPFVQVPERRVITGCVWANRSLSNEKRALGMFGIATGAAIGSGTKGFAEKMMPKSKTEMVQERMQDLGTPEHEQELADIQDRTRMWQLALDDPIISGYAPEDVMEAYNRMAELAPQAIRRHAVAQALVRKYLTAGGALDPFDIDQLMDVEKKVRGQAAPSASEKPLAPNATAD